MLQGFTHILATWDLHAQDWSCTRQCPAAPPSGTGLGKGEIGPGEKPRLEVLVGLGMGLSQKALLIEIWDIMGHLSGT